MGVSGFYSKVDFWVYGLVNWEACPKGQAFLFQINHLS